MSELRSGWKFYSNVENLKKGVAKKIEFHTKYLASLQEKLQSLDRYAEDRRLCSGVTVGQIKEHQAKVSEYNVWLSIFDSCKSPGTFFELMKDDWDFFFGEM